MSLRKINPVALAAAIFRSPMPASLVEQAVSSYVQALVRQELAKNRTVVRLAGMKVGDRWWGYRAGRGQRYVQTPDKQRARLLLDDPKANWIMENHKGRRVVVRVA